MEVFRDSPEPAQPVRRLPVRIEGAPDDLTVMSARMLCNPDGIITHWVRGSSTGCIGEKCPPGLHRLDWVFKAYTAAQQWIEGEQVWRPIALEITESVWPHLAGRDVRGEVWNLWRLRMPNKHTKVLCAIDSVIPSAELPDAFDFRAVVMRTMRCPNVRWGVIPHLPAAVVLEACEGAPPLHRRPELEPSAAPPVPTSPAAARKTMRELHQEFKRRETGTA